MKTLPERRDHGCDGCHHDVATECFIGYRQNVLWICGECRNGMTNNIIQVHTHELPVGDYEQITPKSKDVNK